MLNPQVDKDNMEAIGSIVCAFMGCLAFMVTAMCAELAYVIWKDRRAR